MTIRAIIEQTTALLAPENGTARLDAELLVGHVLRTTRAWLAAHDDTELSHQQETHLATLVARRYKHEPMAYILQRQEFYGRDFFVDRRVLVPRPESETMIELLKTRLSELRTPSSELRIVDVGTGSGALIITAALELSHISHLASHVTYYGLDIDQKCLDVARINAGRYKVAITFKKGNLLSPIISELRTSNFELIILANLPYVPDDFTVNSATLSEPHGAIFGGKDGLDLYRRLFTDISRLASRASTISLFTEALPFQHGSLTDIALEHHFTLRQSRDFIQEYAKVIIETSEVSLQG